MNHLRLLILTCAVTAGLSVLAGCGGSHGDDDAAAKKEPMPMEDTVYGDQIRQMNRTREETSKLTNERMDTLNKALDSQEEGQKEDKAQ